MLGLKTYELTPVYDKAKSFYHKAKVQEWHGNVRLQSYETIVAEIKDGKPIIYGTYSATTLRHIKEFLQQNGFKSGTKNEIIKWYGVER